MNIIGIAFDGMHRSGKGSQIKLLHEYLQNSNIHNIKVRGEYYRHGSGDNILEDPYSLWRKNNIFNTNYEEKSNRINRELAILYNKRYPQYLNKNNINNGIIIQDRSIVGNYLFLSGEGHKINKDINNYYIDKNKVIKKEIIIPQLIFILQPPKKILLERLYNGFNQNEINAEGRLKYKEAYINEKYEQYYNGCSIIPDNIKKNITIISGELTPQETHQIVIKKINSYLHNIFEQEYNCRNSIQQNQGKNEKEC